MLVFEIRTLPLKGRIIVSNKTILNQIFKSKRMILCRGVTIIFALAC